jgi:hypothetical protein
VNAARVIAWGVAVGSVCAVAIGYDSLPAELPVTRWSTAPKSWSLALRIPLINLLSLGLIEVMSQGLRKVEGFGRVDAIVTALLLTAAAKSAIEAAGILSLPASPAWTFLLLVAVLLVGLATASWLGRELFHRDLWKQMQLTRWETVAAVVLVAGIVALNLPLIMP